MLRIQEAWIYKIGMSSPQQGKKESYGSNMG